MTTSNSDLLKQGLTAAADMLDAADEYLDAGNDLPEELARVLVHSYRAALTVITAADLLIESQDKTIEAQKEQLRELSK